VGQLALGFSVPDCICYFSEHGLLYLDMTDKLNKDEKFPLILKFFFFFCGGDLCDSGLGIRLLVSVLVVISGS